MTLGVTLFVLMAAVLHSTSNAIAKHIPHRLASAILFALVFLVAAMVGVTIFGLPAVAAWPFIATYSILDGRGGRESGDSFAHISWLFLLQGLIIPVVIAQRLALQLG